MYMYLKLSRYDWVGNNKIGLPLYISLLSSPSWHYNRCMYLYELHWSAQLDKEKPDPFSRHMIFTYTYMYLQNCETTSIFVC